MLEAARKGDEITHTSMLGGLVAGMLLGALAGAAILATVVTGGLAAAPALMIIGAVCTGAAVGGGIGQLIGGMFKSPRGVITTGARTVFIGSLAQAASRACVDTALCQDHGVEKIATGSATVYIEQYPAARVEDIGQFSFEISKGASNVFIGGEKTGCPGLEIEGEIPKWLQWLHRGLGWIGALCLLGPAYGLVRAVASVIGGEIGAHFGGQIGEKLGGKWGGVIGSVLGGIVGGGIGFKTGGVLQRLEVDPSRLGSNFGNLRLRPSVTDYRGTFFRAHPELEGKVVVHHAVEQQVLRRYPGAMTEAEMHSLKNLRGIPKDVNPDVHLSKIRREWNQFYRENPAPTREQLLQKAADIDSRLGSQFRPPVGER